MKHLALIAALTLGAAPAMAQQYLTTPYGNNGTLVTPYNGGTLGLTTNSSPPPSFVIPNAQLQQTPRPNFCAGFSNAYGQLHC